MAVLLAPRLKKPGIITTDDAWQILRSEFQYNLVAECFKELMQESASKMEVNFIRNGTWFIYQKIN